MIAAARQHGLGSRRQPLEFLRLLRGQRLDLLGLRLLERTGARSSVGGLRESVVRRRNERSDCEQTHCDNVGGGTGQGHIRNTLRIASHLAPAYKAYFSKHTGESAFELALSRGSDPTLRAESAENGK